MRPEQPVERGAPAADHGQLTLAEIERQAIVQTLERTNGNKRAAASILGVYRPTLYGKLKKYKLGEYGPSPKARREGWRTRARRRHRPRRRPTPRDARRTPRAAPRS